MSCIRPGEATPEDLAAYAEGDAPARVVEHVRECAYCAALARDYATTQRRLQRALHRIDCPSPQSLGEYQLGLLSPEERTRVAAHVLECPRCADELQTLRSFLADQAPEPAQLAPIERLRRIVATLLSPQPGLAYAGLRGPADTWTRTYRAEDVTIVVGPEPGARRGRTSLVGLVLREHADPETMGGAEAQLIPSAGSAFSTKVDGLGNFAFAEVPSGEYRLELCLGDQVVVVEGLPIGS